jgi:hypothetical protein
MFFDQEKTQVPGGFADAQLKQQLYEQERRAKSRFVDTMESAGDTQGQIGRAFSEREILNELFSYHAPTPETLPKFAAINQAAKNFAEVVLQNCPASADRSAAIRLIRDARMTANAAVALNGLSL